MEQNKIGQDPNVVEIIDKDGKRALMRLDTRKIIAYIEEAPTPKKYKLAQTLGSFTGKVIAMCLVVIMLVFVLVVTTKVVQLIWNWL